MSRAEKRPETFLAVEELRPELVAVATRLGRIQPEYMHAVARLREKYGIHNRGCGPSSFALAILIQEQLQELGYTLAMDAHTVKPVERNDGLFLLYGAQKENDRWIDHAWIEVILQGQVLLVSHESDRYSSASSFRAAAVRKQHLNHLYEESGLRMEEDISSLQQRVGLRDTDIQQLGQILTSFQQGEIPPNYAEFVSLLLSELRAVE